MYRRSTEVKLQIATFNDVSEALEEDLLFVLYFRRRDCHKSPVESKQPTLSGQTQRESPRDVITVLHALYFLDAAVNVISHFNDDFKVAY